jgi:hypothetical protein
VPGFLGGEGVPPVADFPDSSGMQQFDHVETNAHTAGTLLLGASPAVPFLFEQ